MPSMMIASLLPIDLFIIRRAHPTFCTCVFIPKVVFWYDFRPLLSAAIVVVDAIACEDGGVRVGWWGAVD